MWERLAKLRLTRNLKHLSIAAIGPATKKAIEQRGVKVDVVPKEYVAESVVRSLRRRVKGKRVLLVRAKVARDVIPRELRRAGAQVDVVEAYETVVPQSSRTRLQSALKNPRRRPHVVTFTSSSTVRNFVALLGARRRQASTGYGSPPSVQSLLRHCANLACAWTSRPKSSPSRPGRSHRAWLESATSRILVSDSFGTFAKVAKKSSGKITIP